MYRWTTYRDPDRAATFVCILPAASVRDLTQLAMSNEGAAGKHPGTIPRDAVGEE